MEKKILVVEDEVAIREFEVINLKDGYIYSLKSSLTNS